MPLPQFVRARVESKLGPYCEKRVPPSVRDHVRLGFRFKGNSVTLFEERPAFMKPDTWVDLPVAQFRFDPKNSVWRLYCADRDSKWHEYDVLEPTTDFDALLQEVDQDPTGIFWG
jgi:DUF3024 family protein